MKADEKKKEAAKPAQKLSDSDKALFADAKKQIDALTPSQKGKLMALFKKGDENSP